MAKNIRSLMLPNYSSLLVALMARVVIYDEGIGIQNAAGKTIGWIDIPTQDEELRNEHYMHTATILNELINDPKHAVQPDWSYLFAVAEPEEAVVVQPTPTVKKVEAVGEAKSA